MTMVMPNQKVKQPETYKGIPKLPPKPKPPQPSRFPFIKSKPKHGTIRFTFHVPAAILKRAIAGLCDPTLNPTGFCLMEVCHDGFEMTVYHNRREHPESADDEVYGFLSLKASALTEFLCVRPLVRMVKLRTLCEFLERNAADGVNIRVFNFEGSDLVCFKFPRPIFGLPRRCSIEVPFDYTFRDYPRFPIFSYGFEMSIPTTNLEPLLNHILELIPRRRPPFVSMSIDTSVQIKMGNFGLNVDEKRLVWVLFRYWESLKKVSTLTDSCTLWLASHPVESVVLRLDMRQLGEFMYLKHTPEFFMRKDLPTIGTFWPLFSR